MMSLTTPAFVLLQGFLWLCCLTDWFGIVECSQTSLLPLSTSSLPHISVLISSDALDTEKENNGTQSITSLNDRKLGPDASLLDPESSVRPLEETKRVPVNSTRRGLAIRPVPRTVALVHDVEHSTHIIQTTRPARIDPATQSHEDEESLSDTEQFVSTTPSETVEMTDTSVTFTDIPNATPVVINVLNLQDLGSNRSALDTKPTFLSNHTAIDSPPTLTKAGTTYGRSYEAVGLDVVLQLENHEEWITTTVTSIKGPTQDGQVSPVNETIEVSPRINNRTSERELQNPDFGEYPADSLTERAGNQSVIQDNETSHNTDSETYYNVTGDFTTLPATVLWNSSQTTIIYDFPNTTLEAVELLQTAELGAGSIVGIVIAGFIVSTVLLGAVGYWYYKYQYLHRPQTLQERYAPSELGYGPSDDSFRVGYIHHPDIPKDSSEEMYSLDNDSFLNSLEAMTIPNYWTEQIKHTKL